MSKITDYSFLFQSMFGTKSTKGTSIIGSFKLSQLNSGSIQTQLKAAGIDYLMGEKHMNITKYRLELDENRHNILVRESDTE